MDDATKSPWNKTGLSDATVKYLLLLQNISLDDVQEVSMDEEYLMLYVTPKKQAQQIYFSIDIPMKELGYD